MMYINDHLDDHSFVVSIKQKTFVVLIVLQTSFEYSICGTPQAKGTFAYVGEDEGTEEVSLQ